MNQGTSKSLDVDVAIVGGGMVGSSLALALAQLPIKVALIEPFAPSDQSAPGFDARAIALSRASAKILNTLSLWDDLKGKATAIEHIHVSDKGRPGMCHFSASEVNLPAMGYVVELEDVGKIMHPALSGADIEFLCPAKVTGIHPDGEKHTLTVRSGTDTIEITAAQVVAADGGRSTIRELLGIEVDIKPYDQGAIISTIQTQKDHQNRAYERFTDQGPVAFLPLSENRISLVWMLPPDEAEQMVAAPENEFIQALQDSFGYRLGKITRIGQRHYYPLNLIQSRQAPDGIIFVGNAAQSLHPIAGQGFNLGLRDVADLVDVIREACIEQRTMTDPVINDRYHLKRQADKAHVIGMTDTLARLFANPSLLISLPRNILLSLLAILPEARHEFSRFAMGMNHPASRLTRGLAIRLDESEASTHV